MSDPVAVDGFEQRTNPLPALFWVALDTEITGTQRQQLCRLVVTVLALAVGLVGVLALSGVAVADTGASGGEDERVGPDSQHEKPVENWYDLDEMREDVGTLNGDRVLVNDLNETTEGYEEVASASANGGKGFEPIGNRSVEWDHTFDGQGHNISDFVIDRPDEWDVGLFGAVTGAPVSPQVESVRLVNATVTGDRAVGALVGYHAGAVNNTDAEVEVTGGDYTGGLVGEMIGGNGLVANATVTGTVNSNDGITNFVGGLAGQSGANIENATANVTVNAGDGFTTRAGGLVGWNWGQVTDSSASGDVEGSEEVGALVGYNEGTVERAGATGNASGEEFVGGLVGKNIDNGVSGRITTATASGLVDGSSHVGGLVGFNAGAIERAAATGAVTGTERVGALVGLNGGYEQAGFQNDPFPGTIDRSYATGTVSDAGLPGGLVGAQELNASALTNAYWDGDASGLDVAIGNRTGGIVANVDGLATTAMQGSTAADTMTGFNFEQVWTTGPGAYPRLQDDPTTPPKSTGTLTGTVTDAATGDSIVGAPVVVTDDGVVLNTAATDTDGTYTVVVRPIATTLLVTADGYGEVVRDVTVTESETTTEDVTLQEAAPFFRASIDTEASDLLVTEGETITVAATVENNGTVADTQTVELARFDGQTVDSTSLTLEGGASTSVTLDWPTATDAAGEGDLTVTTANDSTTAPAVVVGQNEGYYDVSVTETGVAAANTALTVDARVENRGDGTDTQDITLAAVDDASGAGAPTASATLTELDVYEDLELAAGAQQEITLTWETTRPDIGNQTLAVASDDVEVEAETAVVPSVEPRFEVAIEELDAAVRPGETLTAVTTVDNAGATGDTQTITLRTETGDVLDSTDLTLPAAGRDTVELTWTPAAGDTGTTDLAVTTANGSESESVAVLEAGIGYRDVTVSDQQVLLGTSITVTATVENTDTVTRSYDAPVTVDTGVVGTVTGELGAGDSETVSTAVRTVGDGEQSVSVGDADAVTVTVESAWAQQGLGDGNTGHSAAVSGPTGPVEEDWSESLAGTPTDPVVRDGRVYVGDDSGTVHAVETGSGTTVWSESLGSAVTAGLAVDGDRVYAGTEDGLVALNTAGTQQWETPLSGTVTGLTRSNDAVYVGTAGGSESVYALDASSGDQQWRFGSGDAVGTPAVAGETVYVGIGQTVYALAADPDAAEREQWSAAAGSLAGGPAHESGTVYVGTDGSDAGVFALDAATGAVDWTTGTGAGVVGSPAVAERVYVGQDNGAVRALDGDNGATEWTFQTTGTSIDGSPAVVDGVVAVSVADPVKEPRLVGIDAESSTQAWNHETAESLSTGPAVLDGAVYAGSEGTLLAVSEQTEGPILDVESISVSETAVSTGDDVEVNVTVTNIGSASSEFEIDTNCQLEGTLFDCGVLVERIDPGEMFTFSTEPVLSQRGEWFVIVDGSTGSSSITATPPGAINGTVTDSQTGDPLDETNVTAEWQAGGRGIRTVEADVTDEGGEYLLPELRPRTYLLRYDRDGYVQKTEFNVPVESAATTTVDVELDELVWLTGTVERPDGSAAVNHTVSADEMIPEAINVTNRTRTGPDGSFRLGVPANDTYALVATEQSYPDRAERYFPENGVADLYASQSVNLTDTDPGETVDVGTVQFPEGYNVNVTVVDAVGDPVVGADVIWRDFNRETFGDFRWLGTNFDGIPGGSFDDPGVELPAGPAEVVVETPWGDRVVRSLTLGTDRTLTVEPAPELANRSSFEIQNLTVERPQFAGDRVTASARIRNVGLVSDTQTVSLDVAGTDAGIEQQRTLQTGENTTVTVEWATSRDDAGEQTVVAATANDSASETFDLIADDEPYFDVAFRTAELVEEGERMNLTARVRNLAAVGGTQDVTMRIDGTPVDRVPRVDLGPGDETRLTLTWNTEVGDAGTHNVTLTTDDQTVNDTLDVLGAGDPQFQVNIDATNAPMTEGSALTVDATIENTGDRQGSQAVTLAVEGVGTDSTAVTLAGGASTTETFAVGTERGDAGSYVATVSSADDTATRVVSVVDPSPDEGEVNLTLEPASGAVAPGGTQSYNVTVEEPDAGIDAYNVVIEVEDHAIANITGFTESRTGGASNSEIRDSGRTLFLEQALLDAAYEPASEATVATFTARHVGSIDESTTITFNQSAGPEITNASNSAYSVNGFNGATLLAVDPPNFQVGIESTSAPVVAGDTLTVNATVENVGALEGSQTVELDVPGTGTDTVSVSLAGGASTTETLSVGVGNCGTYDLTVKSDDDDAATAVDVWASGSTEIDLTGDGQPARDTTCDGHLNNVRGDDQFTVLDVQSLFNNLDNPLVQNNVDLFQFQPRPDPEAVNILDVQGLFNELEASD